MTTLTLRLILLWLVASSVLLPNFENFLTPTLPLILS